MERSLEIKDLSQTTSKVYFGFKTKQKITEMPQILEPIQKERKITNKMFFTLVIFAF